MNKKQVIVLWTIGILSSILLFRGLSVYNESKYLRFLDVYSKGGWKPTVWSYLAVSLIIGGLLIYSLRDRKKNGSQMKNL